MTRASRGEPLRFLTEEVLSHTGDECLEWPYARTADGYGQIVRGGVRVYVHRIVCEAVHGAPPTPKHETAHSCGNRPCCSPQHVSWKTCKENNADKIAHGTYRLGEHTSNAKLTEQDVLHIRALKGMRHREIAARFGITRESAGRIIRGGSWGWLQS